MRRARSLTACALIATTLGLGGCKTLGEDLAALFEASTGDELIPFGATLVSATGFFGYRLHMLLYLPLAVSFDAVFLPIKIPVFIHGQLEDDWPLSETEGLEEADAPAVEEDGAE